MNKQKDSIDKEFEEFKNSTSSKLEPVKIKLYDYSYFHSTSKIQKQRWVERTRLKNKLDSLINQSNSKCGAYLVTGYRGVGKSSIVQEMIEESSFQKNSPFPLRSIIMRIIFLTLSFQLISQLLTYAIDKYNIDIIISHFHKLCSLITLVVILIGLLIYYLIINGFDFFLQKRSVRKNTKTTFSKEFKIGYQFLARIYSYIYNKISSRRYLQFIADYCIIIAAISFTYLIKHFTKEDSVFRIVPIVFASIVAIFFTLFILSDSTHDRISIKNKWLKIAVLLITLSTYYYFLMISNLTLLQTTIWAILAIWIIFYAKHFIKENNALKKSFTINRKLFIHINFGHDELDESDIFRLMAYNLRDKLKKKYKSFKLKFFEFSYKLVICLFLFFLLKNLKIDGDQKFYKSIEYFYSLIQPPTTENKLSSEVTQNKEYDFKATNTGDISIEINSNEPPKKVSILFKTYIATTKSIDALYYSICDNLNIKQPFWMPDYILLLLLFGLVCFAMRIINRKSYYKKILYSLDELISHIEAQVRSTKSAGVNTSGFSTIFSKEKEYPIADVREIERRLIAILESMRKLPFLYQRYEVIFVFDELDKLEPRNNNGSDIANQSEITSGLSPDSVRKRQKNVFKVLANMKYFLTTAKAKFIFLAGREMYDAALADVADRNSFLSSIFYDVIYVPSIFNIDNDDNEPTYTTDFVEQFVCQQLMPHGSVDTYDLKYYNQFLKKNFENLHIPISEKNEENLKREFDEESNEEEKKKIEDKIRSLKIDQRNSTIAKQKREKIIFTLYHFIIYLTHLSNGSTKKMISLFEDYVEMANKEEDILFTEGKLKKGELYLRFDENAQHLFAMINYLAGPMIHKQNVLGNNIYSDKLLVQTSYLTDHILKFHRQAFTDGSLELIPEIVDPNRSPELRSLLNEVIFGYSRTHLEKVSFNLPSYKFNRLIRLEISYLSKLNELASAAFNFSLDESLATKKHYQRLLKKNEKMKDSSGNANSAFSYILGELFFFDEQYEDAINYYSNSLARFNDPESIYKKDIFFYLKVNLRLGLAFEKRKSYEAAFSYYQKSLGASKLQNQEFRDEVEFSKLSYQALLAKLFLIEKSSPVGIALSELKNAEKDFNEIIEYTEKTKTYLFKSDFYYKLAILLYWKSQENPIHQRQILQYLVNSINAIAKSPVCIFLEELKSPNEDDLEKIRGLSIEHINTFISIKGRIFSDYGLSLEEIKQLTKCLSLYGNFLLGIKTDNKGQYGFIEPNFNEKKRLKETANNIEIAVSFFNLAADLAKLNNDDKLFMWQQTKILYLTKFILTHNELLKKQCYHYSSDLLKKIIRAAYSMEDNIYKIEIEKLKNIFSSANSIDKSGISLKRATVVVELEEAITLFSDIEMATKDRDISELYSRYNNTPYCLGTTSLNQILWHKNKFHLNYEIFNKYFFNIDNNCFFKPYRIDEESDGLEKIERINLKQFTFTNFYRWFNNLFSEENNEVFINLNKELGFISKNEDIKNYKNQIFENILFDSLYCGLEIIRIYKSHGDSKLLSNLFMAKIHEYMILWTSIWYFYRDYYKHKGKDFIKSERFAFMWYSDVCLEYFDSINSRDKKLLLINYESFSNHINNEPKPNYSPLNKKLVEIYYKLCEQINVVKISNKKVNESFQLEKLLGKNKINLVEHVYYAEETRKLYHFLDDILKEQYGYKNELQNLYYLNDDFTDDRSHFFMANDRYEMTRNQIRSKIEDLKYLFYSSQYYEPDKYFITVPDREQEWN